MTSIAHGGRLDAAIARHGGEREDWLDLSTGINAKGWKVGEVSPAAFARLPDTAAEKACKDAARSRYGVPERAGISLAPGSQMHIQVLPQLFRPQPVAILGLTYQEHAHCWRRFGHETYVSDSLEAAEATARIVVVVNPNNPDGRIVDRQALVELSRRLGPKGGLLVVDEAFGDVTPNASVCSAAGREGLLVLRSLGKFYGLAGLRLGMAIGNEALTSKLDDAMGPWAVSGPALEIGKKALGDDGFVNRTRKALSAGREALEEVLSSAGMTVTGGTDLFVLCEHPKADALAAHLAAKHILVRSFEAQPTWLRFGIPAGKRDLNRLSKALASFSQ